MDSASPDEEMKKAIAASLASYSEEAKPSTRVPVHLHSWQTMLRDKRTSLEKQLSLMMSDKPSYERALAASSPSNYRKILHDIEILDNDIQLLSDDLEYIANVAAYTPRDNQQFEERVVRRRGNCNVQLLMKYPLYVELASVKVQSPYWRIERNAADGHCFYHTVLRFIHDAANADPSNFFFDSLKNEFLPRGYNPMEQQAQDVMKLRKANLSELKKITHGSPATSYKAYIDAIRESEEKRGVNSSSWAGNGPHEELEFQAMANLLQICIVMWKTIPSKYSVTWIPQSFIPNKTQDYLMTMDLNRDCPNGVMYGVNSMGGQHFDSVMPVATASASASAMPSASTKYDLLDARMNSISLESKKPVVARSRVDTSKDKFISQMLSADNKFPDIEEALSLAKNDLDVAESLLVMHNTSLNELIKDFKDFDSIAPRDIIKTFSANKSNADKTREILLGKYVTGGKRTRRRYRHKKDKKDKKDKKATRRRHKKTTKPNRKRRGTRK
jgi:hypothetical protein